MSEPSSIERLLNRPGWDAAVSVVDGDVHIVLTRRSDGQKVESRSHRHGRPPKPGRAVVSVNRSALVAVMAEKVVQRAAQYDALLGSEAPC